MGKTVKQWGTIGGLVGYSKSWSSPEHGLPPLYRKDDSYSETTYSGPTAHMDAIAASLVSHIDPDADVITYYDFTLASGHPYDTLTVRTGTARKVIDDNA